jgi:uncharacterized membrane protein YedE/YeeE
MTTAPPAAAAQLARAAAAGLLVGLGTSLGNGCTSGHGICGNSRLSARSAAATVTFMMTAMATATLGGSLEATGLAAAAGASTSMVPYSPIAAATLQQGLLLLAGSAAGLAALYAVASRLLAAPRKQQEGGSRLRGALDLVAEAATGLVFGLGLAFSGMARPSKVLGFLSLGAFDGLGAFVPLARWDPSLPFVMGGALLLTLPAFQLIARGKLVCKPLLGDKFSCPASSRVDPRLLGGAALFGAGWGIGGICPGPAMVALAAGQPQVLAFVLAMLGGMAAEKLMSDAAARAQLKGA